jgi:hypothetical protein
MIWRKSSFTHPNDCVEVAWPTESVALRDSKNATGPMLTFGRAEFAYFSAEAQAGSPENVGPLR